VRGVTITFRVPPTNFADPSCSSSLVGGLNGSPPTASRDAGPGRSLLPGVTPCVEDESEDRTVWCMAERKVHGKRGSLSAKGTYCRSLLPSRHLTDFLPPNRAWHR
jgi:hypothetical protein